MDKIMRDGMRLRSVTEITMYKNRELTGWVNTNFSGESLEAAYAMVRWIANKWPDLKERLGVETEIRED